MSTETLPVAPSAAMPGKIPFLPIGIGIAAFAILLAIGIIPRLNQRSELATSVKQVKTQLPSVEVVTPRWVSDAGLNLPGTIQAIDDTTVNARSIGYVDQIYVDIGTRVKAGQIMAVIRSPDMDQQLFQAQAQTAQSRAALGQAQSDVSKQQAGVAQSQAASAQQAAVVEQSRAQLAGTQAQLTVAQAQGDMAAVTNRRYQYLYKNGFDTAQDADQAATNLKTADATVQSAQRNVEAGQKSVSAAEAALVSTAAAIRAAVASFQESIKNVTASQAVVASSVANERRFGVMRSFERVVAPFDGVVTGKTVAPGDLIGASGTGSNPSSAASNSTTGSTTSQGMFEIERTDPVRVLVNVPQTFVPALRAGSRAQATVQEIPGRVFNGTVGFQAGALDTASRTELVEVQIPNRDNVLVPGMYAQVKILPVHPPTTLQVPGTALITDEQGTRVVIVEANNTLHFQPVQVGRDFGTTVEILAGLKGNEKLVNNPPDTLQERNRVQIAQPAGRQTGTPKPGSSQSATTNEKAKVSTSNRPLINLVDSGMKLSFGSQFVKDFANKPLVIDINV